MPKKIRELKQLLRRAGWFLTWGGKGSHSRWKHENVPRTITLSGNDGDDAGPRQEADIQQAVREAAEADRK